MLLHCILHSGIALYSVAWHIMAFHSIVQHGAVALHFSWPIAWRQITGRPVDESGGGGIRKGQKETYDVDLHLHLRGKSASRAHATPVGIGIG